MRYKALLKHFYKILLVAIVLTTSAEAKRHKTVETVGDVVQITIPLSALGISWYKDDTQGVKELFYSVLTSTAATWALKLAINKKRPRGGRYSFPSAHTSTAFSGSSYLGFRYGMGYGIPYSLASAFVGYSRVNAHRHYWTDVIAGGAVGAISAYFFTSKYEPKVKPTKEAQSLKSESVQ